MNFQNLLRKTGMGLAVIAFGSLFQASNAFANTSCLEFIYQTQFFVIFEKGSEIEALFNKQGGQLTPEQEEGAKALQSKIVKLAQEVQDVLGSEKLKELVAFEEPSSDDGDPFAKPDDGKIGDDPFEGWEPLPGDDGEVKDPWEDLPIDPIGTDPLDPSPPPPTDDWGFGWTKDPFNQYIKAPLGGESKDALVEIRAQTLEEIRSKNEDLAGSLDKKLSQLLLKTQVEIMRLTLGISPKRASEILSDKTLVSIDLLLETKEKAGELAKEEIQRSAIRALVEYLNEAHGSLAEFPAFDGDVVTRVEYALSVYAPRLSLSHVYLQSLLRGVEKTSGSANYSLKETEVRYLDERGVLRKLSWKVRPY